MYSLSSHLHLLFLWFFIVIINIYYMFIIYLILLEQFSNITLIFNIYMYILVKNPDDTIDPFDLKKNSASLVLFEFA